MKINIVNSKGEILNTMTVQEWISSSGACERDGIFTESDLDTDDGLDRIREEMADYTRNSGYAALEVE